MDHMSLFCVSPLSFSSYSAPWEGRWWHLSHLWWRTISVLFSRATHKHSRELWQKQASLLRQGSRSGGQCWRPLLDHLVHGSRSSSAALTSQLYEHAWKILYTCTHNSHSPASERYSQGDRDGKCYFLTASPLGQATPSLQVIINFTYLYASLARMRRFLLHRNMPMQTPCSWRASQNTLGMSLSSNIKPCSPAAGWHSWHAGRPLLSSYYSLVFGCLN